ncbi:MAG: hypothetical protein JW384_02049 [Nitrosomonadaceae bacterium]|nr:hypothetical protein [Nitrosomonadaceae bacterium]
MEFGEFVKGEEDEWEETLKDEVMRMSCIVKSIMVVKVMVVKETLVGSNGMSNVRSDGGTVIGEIRKDKNEKESVVHVRDLYKDWEEVMKAKAEKWKSLNSILVLVYEIIKWLEESVNEKGLSEKATGTLISVINVILTSGFEGTYTERYFKLKCQDQTYAWAKIGGSDESRKEGIIEGLKTDVFMETTKEGVLMGSRVKKMEEATVAVIQSWARPSVIGGGTHATVTLEQAIQRVAVEAMVARNVGVLYSIIAMWARVQGDIGNNDKTVVLEVGIRSIYGGRGFKTIDMYGDSSGGIDPFVWYGSIWDEMQRWKVVIKSKVDEGIKRGLTLTTELQAQQAKQLEQQARQSEQRRLGGVQQWQQGGLPPQHQWQQGGRGGGIGSIGRSNVPWGAAGRGSYGGGMGRGGQQGVGQGASEQQPPERFVEMQKGGAHFKDVVHILSVMRRIKDELNIEMTVMENQKAIRKEVAVNAMNLVRQDRKKTATGMLTCSYCGPGQYHMDGMCFEMQYLALTKPEMGFQCQFMKK